MKNFKKYTAEKWEEILQTADAVFAPTYSRPSGLFVDGCGAVLFDARGEDYLDMTSGIGVNALGHRSQILRDGIEEAASGLTHISNLYHSLPPVELALRLVEHSFADKVFFCNSGTEAVEAAIKFARLAGGPAKREIISFNGSFHGRTLGALAATDRPEYRSPFEPLPGDFKIAPWNEFDALQQLTENTAAVLLEPIQGEQGIRVADNRWLQSLCDKCKKIGALLIFDEVQCGMGRTGTLWAYEQTPVVPDMMTLAKPLAGGLPIGAVLMTNRVSQNIRPGLHGTTFGGGPFITSVACQVFDQINSQGFLDSVKEKGRLLRERLETLTSMKTVEEIRGRGLMVGVRLSGLTPKDVVAAAFDQKLLIVPSADGVVRFLPPLNISAEQVKLAVDRFELALSKCDRAG